MSPPSPNPMLSSEIVFGGFQKNQPFLLMMLGTSDHNIEVGGGGQGIIRARKPESHVHAEHV